MALSEKLEKFIAHHEAANVKTVSIMFLKERLPEVIKLEAALKLMLKSPSDRLAYCKENRLLPNPITVDASVDDYWREAIAKHALTDLEDGDDV